MSFTKDLPLYTKSDLRYLYEKLVPITKLGTFHYGSIYCPFHLNTNTPAASLFKDSDNVERIYCYRCRRQYTSYDYMASVLEKDPLKYLLKRYSKEELDNYLKFKVDIHEEQTRNLKFESIEKLLIDVYEFDKSISVLNS